VAERLPATAGMKSLIDKSSPALAGGIYAIAYVVFSSLFSPAFRGIFVESIFVYLFFCLDQKNQKSRQINASALWLTPAR
jgi:hypothetical protein